MFSLVVGGTSAGGLRRFHIVYSGGARVVRTQFLDEALSVLRKELAFWIADAARTRIFLHAGAVALDGRALLLPGRSGAGKSSLVAALLEAGASYLSDEYAPLDRRGRVHPCPLPLQLPPRPGDPPDTATRSARALGAAIETRALPVAGVIVCRYRPGVRWQARLLSPGHGLLRMMDNAVPARRFPERTLEVLSALAESAPVLVAVRGEAAECTGTILEWFGKTRTLLRRAS